MKPFSMLFTIILTCSFLQVFSQDETPLKAQIVVHNNLAVTSQPTGVTVKLDGRETGKTPWTSYKLDPGEYTIEVSHPA
ncbi:MAG: PEGA domain-containing protein, partial [Lentisphaerae bacterium]